MKTFVIRWLVTAASVLVAVKLIPGIYCESLGALLGTALMLGIINALVRPVLLLLSLPFILLTLGFFILIINAIILEVVSGIIPGFQVQSFTAAFFGSILISLVSWLLSSFFRDSSGKVQVLTHHAQIKQAQGRVIK